jgi:hypothetical protein
MVAEHTVLDVAAEVGELAPETVGGGGVEQLRGERTGGDPVADAGRERIRMPAVAAARRVPGDPAGDARRRSVDLAAARPAEDLVAVVEVEPPQARRAGQRPVGGRVGDAPAEQLDGAVARDPLGSREGRRAPERGRRGRQRRDGSRPRRGGEAAPVDRLEQPRPQLAGPGAAEAAEDERRPQRASS